MDILVDKREKILTAGYVQFVGQLTVQTQIINCNGLVFVGKDHCA